MSPYTQVDMEVIKQHGHLGVVLACSEDLKDLSILFNWLCFSRLQQQWPHDSPLFLRLGGRGQHGWQLPSLAWLPKGCATVKATGATDRCCR